MLKNIIEDPQKQMMFGGRYTFSQAAKDAAKVLGS